MGFYLEKREVEALLISTNMGLVIILSPAPYSALAERAGGTDCYNYPPNAWLRFSDGLVVELFPVNISLNAVSVVVIE